MEESVLAPCELMRVLDCSDEHHWAAIALAIYCGRRQAEVLGLQRSDIDWEKGEQKFVANNVAESLGHEIKIQPSFRRAASATDDTLREWHAKCPGPERSLVCAPRLPDCRCKEARFLETGSVPRVSAHNSSSAISGLEHSFVWPERSALLLAS